MPVRIAAAYWFRNSFESEKNDNGFFWDEKKKQAAQQILYDFAALEWFEDETRDTTPIVGDGFALIGGVDLISYPKQPEKLRDILLRTHHLLVPPLNPDSPLSERIKDPFVNPDVYFRMGKTFKQMGMEVEDPDLKYIIERATSICERPFGHGPRDQFDPRRELERRDARISNKEKL